MKGEQLEFNLDAVEGKLSLLRLVTRPAVRPEDFQQQVGAVLPFAHIIGWIAAHSKEAQQKHLPVYLACVQTVGGDMLSPFNFETVAVTTQMTMARLRESFMWLYRHELITSDAPRCNTYTLLYLCERGEQRANMRFSMPQETARQTPTGSYVGLVCANDS